jgi:hypothetical protein
MDDIVIAYADILGIAAVQVGIAEKFALVAGGFATTAAEAAGATDMATLGGANTIARLEVPNRWPDRFNDARDLMAGYQRHAHAALHDAIAGDNIVKADAAGLDPDPDIVGSKRWHRNIFQPQVVRRTGITYNHGSHHGLLCASVL